MITSAIASQAAINSGIWFRRQTASFPSGFSSGLPAASRKFLPLTSTFNPIEKGNICGLRRFESHILAKVYVQPVATKLKGDSEANAKTQLLLNTGALESTFEAVIVPYIEASSAARTSGKERNPKRLNSSSSQSKKSDHLPVIRYPLATESTLKAILESNTLVFVVDKRADKKNIKDDVKKMFKVRAKKVNTLIMPDGTKKAYIMLAPEYNALDVAKKIKIL